MKQLAVVLLLGLLALASLVGGLAEPSDGITAAIPDTPSGAAEPDPEPDPVPLTGDAGRADALTGAGPDRVAPPGTEAARSITVTGRCVDAMFLSPLVGCRIAIATQRPDQPRDPATATELTAHTDADGRFSAEIAMPEQHMMVLGARMDGRADVTGIVGRLPRNVDVVDIGDIPMPPGARLYAHVVDETGRPLPGVAIGFRRHAPDEHQTFRSRSTLGARSSEGGTLAIDVCLQSGAWSLSAPEHMTLIRPAGRLEIAAGQHVQELTIVLRPPDPETVMTGVVVDTVGQPIPSVRIEAVGEDGRVTGSAVADERGEFGVKNRRDSRTPVHLRIRRAPGFDDLLTPESFDWGSQGIVLTLHSAGDLLVTVVEAGTDRPVEDFQLSWFEVDEDSAGSLFGSHAAAGHHEGGVVTVEGVPSGRIQLVVTPSSEMLAPNDPVEFVKTSGRPEIRVELKRRVILPVQVVFGDGRPVSGTKLELVGPGEGQQVGLNDHGLTHAHYFQQGHRDSYALVLDGATTDETGNAELRWPASAAPLTIRVLGPGHMPTVERRVFVRERSEPIRITVSAGATFSGVVRPLSVLQDLGLQQSISVGMQGPTIVLTPIGEPRSGGPHRRRTQRLERDGSFRFTGLLPGAWSVAFRVRSIDARRISSPGNKEFAPVTFIGDEHQRAEYDISDLRPALLRGQVVLDGVPAANRQVHLARMREVDGGSLVHAGSTVLNTDRDGNFVAEGIHPGRYGLSISSSAGGSQRADRLVCAESVDIAPGGQVSREFRIHTGTLELHVTDSEGAPVAGGDFVIHNPQNGFRARRQSDEQGVVRVEQIAAGDYTVSIHQPELGAPPGSGGSRLRSLGDVAVAPGPTVSSARLEMPEK